MTAEEGAVLPVTVVIPAYNREELIIRALDSVQSQTRRPADVVVVDDCSTDHTASVAERMGARVIRHQENRGAAVARNTGFSVVKTEWVALLDSDDEWLPWHLETVWGARGTHVLVAGSALHIGDDGKPVRIAGPPRWQNWIIRGPERLIFPDNIIAASGALVRTGIVKRAGGYDPELRYAEDFDLWTRLLLHGSAHCLARVTILYRYHGDQKSQLRVGAGAAQRLIASRADRSKGRRLLERRLGVRKWDDAREAACAKEWSRAVRLLGEIGRRPDRVRGVLTIWVWRRLVRRRARALTADGKERIAVMSGEFAAMARPHLELEDWRSRSHIERAVALATAPPRRVAGADYVERLLCRAADVDTGADLGGAFPSHERVPPG